MIRAGVVASSRRRSTMLGLTAFASDVFTEATTINLETHTADLGGMWGKVGTGTMVAGQGTARQGNSNTSTYFLPAVPPSADYEVSAKLTFASLLAGASTGVTIRNSTTSVQYYGWRYSQSAGSFGITRQFSGGSVLAGTVYSYSPTLGEVLDIKIGVVGSVITGYVKIAGTWVAVSSANDTAITAAGRPGLLSGAGAATGTTGTHVSAFFAAA